MTFSDDDLKRLKDALKIAQSKNIEVWTVNGLEKHDLIALLSRLEAAEDYVHGREHLEIKMEPGELVLLKAWRKACGK